MQSVISRTRLSLVVGKDGSTHVYSYALQPVAVLLRLVPGHEPVELLVVLVPHNGIQAIVLELVLAAQSGRLALRDELRDRHAQQLQTVGVCKKKNKKNACVTLAEA